MKDEFTTLMHADMLGWSKEDAMLIESYAQILRGLDKAEVCRKHGFSIEYYDANIEEAKKKMRMTIQQVKEFFSYFEQAPYPLTEELVKAGYQQVSGGYIDRAKREGIIVDYKINAPSQYWHLMTYCESRDT